MVVYFSDSTFDEVKQHSELADESPKRHEEAFQRIKNLIETRREPRSPLMLNCCPPLRRPGLTLLERLLNYEDIANYDAEILAELYNPAQRGSFRAFLHGKKHSGLRFLLNPSGAMPMLPAPEEIALLNFDRDSDLVADPETALQRTCDGIRLEYSAGMVEYGASEAGRKQFRYGDAHTVYENTRPVAHRVGRWRELLAGSPVWTNWAHGYVHALGRDLIEALGYDFDELVREIGSGSDAAVAWAEATSTPPG